MLLIDTNVLAYLTIEGDRTPAARRLYERDSDWRSETFILVEYSNILATYIRGRALTLEQGARLLAAAEALMPALASTPHRGALEAAAQFRISAYDARFIALAMRMRVKLITEDVKLRAAVPAWTLSMNEAFG